MRRIAANEQASQPAEADDEPAQRWSRERRWEEEAVDEIAESLMDEHGAEAVLAELSKGKDDPLVAAAIFEVCSMSGHRLREFFNGDEIVSAALAYLLTVETWTSNVRDGLWAWSALFQHDCGSVDHFDDEEHFGLLLDLIAVSPMDDSVLFMIGDGPLSHAAANPSLYARIQKLAETDPKIARAWWLNVTDGGRLDAE